MPGNHHLIAVGEEPLKKGRAKSKATRHGRETGGGKVRPAKVARARALIAQPDYPPPEVIAAVAVELAQQLPLPARRRSF